MGREKGKTVCQHGCCGNKRRFCQAQAEKTGEAHPSLSLHWKAHGIHAIALLAGLEQGQDRAALAADFHATVAAAAEAVVRRLARQCGVRTVALSGGVFQNMTLLRQLVARLQGDFTVLVNRQVPANDGGISLGQAAVARERSW